MGNLQELEKLIIEQGKSLIKYKDSQIKPVLQTYKQLLEHLQEEVTRLYAETNIDGKWDWATIASKQLIETLFAEVEKSLQEVVKMSENILNVSMKKVITVDFALASFLVSKQMNDWIPIPSVIPKRTLKEIMDIPWSGDHFSGRIWHNKDLLKINLRRELTSAIVTGESFPKTTSRLKKVLETDAYKAERLVRTEIIAASNRAQKEHYKQFNERFAKYNMLSSVKVLETLDRRTCSRCREMDGQLFGPDEMDGIADVEHPRCRRRLVPIIRGFDESNVTRAARDGDGKYYRTNAKTFGEFAEEQGIPVHYK